ncbi:hypothetical protein ASD02_23820 [Ensifer sp. Root1252]|nr:hypothetical protein ASD02_23820 [Ensifer sp. Root1252]KQW71266.1 hypothetical protein ASD03_33080 [Ensifer sp. Root127]KRC78061.1 hypothetical protein ASE32_28430 [Ensifer sp. Root231]KRD00482.1 hypothetical protein ASE47_24400 [Ensifer sp. Root258]
MTLTVKDRDYWYFDLPTPEGKDKRSYVGPHSDEAITERVKAHKEIKGNIRERRRMVSTLVLASPVPIHSRATSRKPSLTPDCSGCGLS